MQPSGRFQLCKTNLYVRCTNTYGVSVLRTVSITSTCLFCIVLLRTDYVVRSTPYFSLLNLAVSPLLLPITFPTTSYYVRTAYDVHLSTHSRLAVIRC
jgi:hypothetical protein